MILAKSAISPLISLTLLLSGVGVEGSSYAVGRHAMVTTTNNLATAAGLNILKKGGNAVDASIAIQFALGVVQPMSTGIGGGAFILLHNASTGITHALDGREEAPNAFHGKTFCKNPDCLLNPNCDCSQGTVAHWDK
jgi:gamma-glutamyltranspeptidase/glutathione hydrolase